MKILLLISCLSLTSCAGLAGVFTASLSGEVKGQKYDIGVSVPLAKPSAKAVQTVTP